MAAWDNDDPVAPSCEDLSPLLFVEMPFRIGADQYLRDRFFALDRPEAESGGGRGVEKIVASWIKVFRLEGAGSLQSNDIQNGAAYFDSARFRSWPDLDFSMPHTVGMRWHEQAGPELLVGADGEVVAIDMGEELPADAEIAVTCSVKDGAGSEFRIAHDRAGGPPVRTIAGGRGPSTA